MTPPLVTVVIPVLNEAQDLPDLLLELRGQTPPAGGFEVLVVDGGSTDATRSIVTEAASSWPALHLHDNPGRRSAPGRNVGIREAVGRFVLFVDGHCSIPRKDYLLRLADVFESSGAECLCRPQPLRNLAEGSWAEAVARARHSRFGHAPGSDIYGSEPGYTLPHSAGSAYRREILVSLGGFDERFDACEDVELNHRVAEAGYRAYVHPDLAVYYRPRESLGSFFRQMFRYGRGRGRLAVRHPRLLPWPLVVVSLLGLAALALPVLVRGGLGLGLFAVTVASWAALCLVEGIRQGGFGARGVRTASALGGVHVGLTLGFWRGLLEYRAFRAPLEPAPHRGAESHRVAS